MTEFLQISAAKRPLSCLEFPLNLLFRYALLLLILADPKFRAFIPQHALTLAQNFSQIYMLFPMDESAFLPDLVTKVSVEAEVESQKTLLLTLWYTATKTGRTAINEFVENKQKSAEATAYAKIRADQTVPLLSYLTTSTEKSLRVGRN